MINLFAALLLSTACIATTQTKILNEGKTKTIRVFDEDDNFVIM